jgi:hypothetical protein
MAFFLNEISLHNQYHNLSQFIESLKTVLGCKELLHRYLFELNCSDASLGNRIVMNGDNLRSVIGNLQDHNLQRVIRRWIDQEGPFWDDEKNRMHSPDEYFSCDEEVVTDTSLAEASYLTTIGHDAAVVSFNPSNYLLNPIYIRWNKSTDEFIDIAVSNYWERKELEQRILAIAPPIQSWKEMISRAKTEFTNLFFLESFEEGLKGQPFSSTIADHAIDLLRILNELKQCFNETGNRNPRGHEIYQEYFTGENAKFSDESDPNKVMFQKDLTFYDPSGNLIFCPYHGKISHRYYRLHFNWPITRNGTLYIAYLGPKITKE